MAFASETALARHVAKWMMAEGWEVFYEVFTYDGEIDIVGRRDGLLWAVECKSGYGPIVCAQAFARLPWVHYASVAVPSSSRETHAHWILDDFLEREGIGKLVADAPEEGWKGRVLEEINPRFQRAHLEHRQRTRAENMRELVANLTEHHKLLVPGAPNGQQLTPFKLTIKRIEEYLAKNGPSTMKQIVEGAAHHYRCNSGARQNLAKAMAQFPEVRTLFLRDKEGLWHLRKPKKEKAS